MVKKSFFYVCSALIMGLFACGCINVEYVGQSFPELPEDTQVIVYSKESPMPADTYHAIGRATVTAPEGKTLADVRLELIDLARAHGAEAVNIAEYKQIQIGVESQDPAVPLQPGWRNDGRNAGGDFIYSNSFGDVTTMPAPGRPIYELQVKALLLVTNARFEKMRKLYSEQRQAIIENAEAAEKREVLAPQDAVDNVLASPLKQQLPETDQKSPEVKQDKKPVQLDLSDHRNAPAAL